MPDPIRSVNGPDYIRAVTSIWTEKRGIRIDFTQSGQSKQNPCVKYYNRTVRFDWLTHHLSETLGKIQEFTTSWLCIYNHDRPNMGIGDITLNQKLAFAA